MRRVSDGTVLMGGLSDGAECFGGETESDEGADAHGSGIEAELLGPLAPAGDGTLAHTRRRDLSDPPPQHGATRQRKKPPRRTGHCGDSDHREKWCAADDEDETENTGKRAVGEKQDETADGKKPGADRETHEPALTGQRPLVGHDAAGDSALAPTR